jgi:hypothetical protein
MFINGTIVNNFKLSPPAREALNAEFLIPRCAFKPMHKIFNKTNDTLARVAMFVLPKKVQRGRHIYNVCRSNALGSIDVIEEPAQGEVEIQLLHIIVEPVRFVIDPTPNLFFSSVYHGRKRDHWRGDGKPTGKILCEVHGASAIRPLYSAYLWTDSKCLSDHPKFVVYPSRMGDIKLLTNTSTNTQ